MLKVTLKEPVSLSRNKVADYWYHPKYTGVIIRHKRGFAMFRSSKLYTFPDFETAKEAYLNA